MGRKRHKSKKRRAARARKKRKSEITKLTKQESDEKRSDESTGNKEQAGQNKDKKNVSEKWRVRKVFQKREKRFLITLLIGLSFVLSGIIIVRRNEIDEIPDWQKQGPLVAIACDRSLQGVNVTCYTTVDGKTKLLISEAAIKDIWPEIVKRYGDTRNIDNIEEVFGKFDKNNMNIQDSEEYHLWVYVASLNASIEWSIDERVGNVENYKIGEGSTIDNYKLIKSGELQGTDSRTAFRITFGSDYINTAEIEISEPTGHVMYRTNGICRVVLPRIGAWFGGIAYDLLGWESTFDRVQHSGTTRMAGLDMLKLTINGKPMYYAWLKIDASYTVVPEMMQSDLELMLVNPESTGGYPLIRWSEYDHIFPIVQFRDTKWENNILRDSLLGGIFVGLGVNVISLLGGFRHRKKGD